MTARPPLTITISRLLRRHRRLLAALLAGWAGYLAITELQPPPEPTVRLIVAAHNLAAGTSIATDDVRSADWLAIAEPPGAAHATEAIIGRILAVPVQAGQPLAASLTASPESLTLQSSATGRATVAVPIRLGDPGAAALLRAGDLVDVWASRIEAVTDSNGAPSAARVAAAARVIAVPRPDSGSLGSASGGLVVIAVPETTASGLAYAAATARLTVAVLQRAP